MLLQARWIGQPSRINCAFFDTNGNCRDFFLNDIFPFGIELFRNNFIFNSLRLVSANQDDWPRDFFSCIFLETNYNDCSCVAVAFKFSNAQANDDRSISNLFIADAHSSIITRPQIIMPKECQEFVFLIGEWDRELGQTLFWKRSQMPFFSASCSGFSPCTLVPTELIDRVFTFIVNMR